MASVNKVILIGNLGQDPEVKYMPSGGAVTNVSIATTDTWTDKNTNQKQERTEWHRVVFFNRLAEIVGEYLRKGSPVYIEGRLQTRKWQDQSGMDRYTTEIIADRMQMLGGRPSGDSAGYGSAPAQGQHNMGAGQGNPAPQPNAAPQQPAPPSNNVDDFEDDIPF